MLPANNAYSMYDDAPCDVVPDAVVMATQDLLKLRYVPVEYGRDRVSVCRRWCRHAKLVTSGTQTRTRCDRYFDRPRKLAEKNSVLTVAVTINTLSCWSTSSYWHFTTFLSVRAMKVVHIDVSHWVYTLSVIDLFTPDIMKYLCSSLRSQARQL